MATNATRGVSAPPNSCGILTCRSAEGIEEIQVEVHLLQLPIQHPRDACDHDVQRHRLRGYSRAETQIKTRKRESLRTEFQALFTEQDKGDWATVVAEYTWSRTGLPASSTSTTLATRTKALGCITCTPLSDASTDRIDCPSDTENAGKASSALAECAVRACLERLRGEFLLEFLTNSRL